jgi:hypothetical protein
MQGDGMEGVEMEEQGGECGEEGSTMEDLFGGDPDPDMDKMIERVCSRDGSATCAFSKGKGTVRLLFSRKGKQTSGSTFQFPGEVSSLAGVAGTRLMQQ